MKSLVGVEVGNADDGGHGLAPAAKKLRGFVTGLNDLRELSLSCSGVL
ncbi:MAG: hypothetical protein WCG66_12485 [bacterium]